MQTTKWGGPGWKQLHSIVSKYPNNPNQYDRDLYRFFLIHIGNILPCIHCRRSYRQYIKEIPIDDWLDNQYSLECFLYLIHNKVNDKLRTQGFLHVCNPPFDEVRQKYEQPRVYDDCGWDFIYAIVFNFPIEPTGIDKYNVLWYFDKLQYLLPYEPARQLYQHYYEKTPIGDYLIDRYVLIEWFYDIHTKILNSLICNKFLPKTQKKLTYDEMYNRYESFRAGNCNTKTSVSCRLPVKK